MADNKGFKALGFVGLLAAAAAVFIVCSIIQGIGDSSMFSTEFTDPDNALLELLMQVSFYPGWVATVLLVIGAFATLLSGDSSETTPSESSNT